MSEEFDFVVIGSGGGSMAAALFMRSLGKSVLVLEKTDLLGGSTAMSGGVMWIPNNRFMKEMGVEDSPQKAASYLDAVIGDDPADRGATPSRRRAYIAEAPKMLDFLIGQGVPFRGVNTYPDYYDDAPGGLAPGRTVLAKLFDVNELGEWKSKLRPCVIPVPAYIDEVMKVPMASKTLSGKLAMAKIGMRMIYTKITKKQLATGGGALQGRVLNANLKAGTEFRLNSPVKSIVVENGRAVGVITTKDGADHRINAKLGVLINAGGFSKSQSMRDKYLPGTQAAWSNTAPGDTGEMIEEAMRLGAATAQMDATIGQQIAIPPGPEVPFKPMLQGDAAKPHAIVVDQSGVRYMNETGSYVDFCDGMKARHKISPALPSWLVVDSQFTSEYTLMMQKGPEKLEPMVQGGFLKKGETLEKLAEVCGMDAGKLKASIDRFNGFARNGKDEDFGRGSNVYQKSQGDPTNKPATTMGTVEQGPFYAIQLFPGDVGTYGGVVTDENARVLREDGTPIAGLYATGTSTASAMGKREPAAGGSVGPSYVWGYVAAKHAAGANQ